jgi:hypothetical protein
MLFSPISLSIKKMSESFENRPSRCKGSFLQHARFNPHTPADDICPRYLWIEIDTSIVLLDDGSALKMDGLWQHNTLFEAFSASARVYPLPIAEVRYTSDLSLFVARPPNSGRAIPHRYSISARNTDSDSAQHSNAHYNCNHCAAGKIGAGHLTLPEPDCLASVSRDLNPHGYTLIIRNHLRFAEASPACERKSASVSNLEIKRPSRIPATSHLAAITCPSSRFERSR